MAILSEFRLGLYRDDDHQEDAPDFIIEMYFVMFMMQHDDLQEHTIFEE